MFKEQYPDSELTGKIIGCAMEVHKALGNGFQEVIYQRAPEIEMHLQGLDFSREHEMDFFIKEKISELEGLIFCRGENYG